MNDDEVIAQLQEEITLLKADIEMLKQPSLARNQPCGCVVCHCEGTQCKGCGATNCGTHALCEIPNPVFVVPMVRLDDPVVKELVECLKEAAEDMGCRSLGKRYIEALSAYEARVKEVSRE
jgi:hypothetical protein